MTSRHLQILLIWLAFVGMGAAAQPGLSVHRWGLHEVTLVSSRDYTHPLLDAELRVELVSPSGHTHAIDGFWDGARTWRFRFSPGELGPWSWRTTCSDSANPGLHGQTGSFQCTAYSGENPFYRHGRLKVAANRTSFSHADGTPFLWIADTAWNGALRSTNADWETYLDQRVAQRFTAIQFVSTQWRGATSVLPKLPYTHDDRKLSVNPDVFQQLDARINAIHARGLLAVPVMLWALRPTDPGQALPTADGIKLARYLMARWGAGPCAWFLGGDGRFDGAARDHWLALGRGVFDDRHDQLATLHPVGRAWPHDEFWDEPWFQFAVYQSGHRSKDSHFRWLHSGPPAHRWKREPVRPTINIEPQYENNDNPIVSGSAADIRKHIYWSMLVAPTAGVSYGNGPIWVWNPVEPSPAEGHGGVHVVDTWRAGLDTDGVRSTTQLAAFFASGPWSQLHPAPELLRTQPGIDDGSAFIAVSRASETGWTVAYVPQGSRTPVELAAALPDGVRARWFDPRTGRFRTIGVFDSNRPVFVAPDALDWILDLRAPRDP